MTHEQVVMIFAYEPSTGNLIWRHTGNIAGSVKRVNDNQYVYVGFECKRYMAHKLVWCWHNKVYPSGYIRHKDNDTLNNRIENLEIIERKRRPKGNKREAEGAYRHGDRWMAQIKINGYCKYLGYYDTKEEAHAVFLKAKQEYKNGR